MTLDATNVNAGERAHRTGPRGNLLVFIEFLVPTAFDCPRAHHMSQMLIKADVARRKAKPPSKHQAQANEVIYCISCPVSKCPQAHNIVHHISQMQIRANVTRRKEAGLE